MSKSEETTFKIGQRAYHVAFGWGTITHYAKGMDGMCIDLDAIHISHYVMGKGYVEIEQGGKPIKTLYTPINQVVSHPNKIGARHSLLKMSLNATVTYPEGYIPDHKK